MKSKKIGIAILVVGILFMFFMAWINSWFYVPGYRNLGPRFITMGETWHTSAIVSNLWSSAGPIGALLIMLGSALKIGMEKKYILLSTVLGSLLLYWFHEWFIYSYYSVVFGIGGGLIALSFSLYVLNWAKKRSSLSSKNRIASDIRLIGLMLFFFAAWGLCGLLGSPIFGLRPEHMMEYDTQAGGFTLATKVMICLASGWVAIAVSQFMEKHETAVKD